MITAITPTGDRPLAFSLCRRWMEQQTRKPDQWIVVDDGKNPMQPFDGIDYIRREPLPGDPKFTLAENLKAAIPHIKGDKIIIIEDDEYYAPIYIEVMRKNFGRHEVVGIGKSRYYHLPSGGYMIIGNMGHASLAQTAISKSFLPIFQSILVPGKLYIDYEIWRRAKMRKSGRVFLDPKPIYVGIKGLPGRAGIGRGHDRKIYRLVDRGRRILRQWIPLHHQVYLDLLKK